MSHGNGDPCKPNKPGHKAGNDPCKPKPKPKPPAAACGPAVDSTQPDDQEQFLAALNQGVPFAGRRGNISSNPENTTITSGSANTTGWDDLSDITGFPTNSPVCDISVDANGHDAFYKIVTQNGAVYTLHCAANGTSLVCPDPGNPQRPPSQWRQVTALPNA